MSVRTSIAATFVILLPLSISAQAAPTAAFITRLGKDTTAIERYTLRGNSYSIEQVTRSPITILRHTHLEMTPEGNVKEFFMMRHDIENPAGKLLGSAKLVAGAGDSATVEMRTGDSLRTRGVRLRGGLIPSLGSSFLAYEIASMRMRAARADSMRVSLVSPAGDTTPIAVRRIARDSVLFDLPFFSYRAQVDGEGRILGLFQPLGITVERVSDIDINAIAKAWLTLDKSGKAMGPLSPSDSVITKLGNANISIRYQRPRTRGREVFGTIAAWDAVWRTGANAATVLTTDRDLRIGNANVPKGSYTLFSIPSRSGTTLIISKETMRNGQPLAGTEYDAAQDFARIPMKTTALSSVVEPFTIEIVPGKNNRGELRLSWDRRLMTVPIEVR